MILHIYKYSTATVFFSLVFIVLLRAYVGKRKRIVYANLNYVNKP